MFKYVFIKDVPISNFLHYNLNNVHDVIAISECSKYKNFILYARFVLFHFHNLIECKIFFVFKFSMDVFFFNYTGSISKQLTFKMMEHTLMIWIKKLEVINVNFSRKNKMYKWFQIFLFDKLNKIKKKIISWVKINEISSFYIEKICQKYKYKYKCKTQFDKKSFSTKISLTNPAIIFYQC